MSVYFVCDMHSGQDMSVHLIDEHDGSVTHTLRGPENRVLAVARRAVKFAGPYIDTMGIASGIDNNPGVTVSFSQYPMVFNKESDFHPDYICGYQP